MDTLGTKIIVLISEVSLFQRENIKFYVKLGLSQVFRLTRCPYFRGVLKERFHCTTQHIVHLELV